MELDELLKDENTTSPDFTAEEAASATDTASANDFAVKVSAHLKKLIDAGGWGRTDFQRRKFGGVDYTVLRFEDSKRVFKMAWLR
jgi:hypothetical protein